jgi:uncharacterized membrane protein YphA (DoxX/SURF4 family)
MFGAFGHGPFPLVSQIGVGGVIELFGGILIAIGLFTSCAAFIASGTMAVAYFQFHQPGGPLADRERRGDWRSSTASPSCTSRRTAPESGAWRRS